MSFSKHPWQITGASFPWKVQRLFFQMVKQTANDEEATQHVLASQIGTYRSPSDIKHFIETFTNNQCHNIPQLRSKLKKEAEGEEICQVYYGDSKLVRLKCFDLRNCWEIFDNEKFAPKYDVKELILKKVDSLLPAKVNCKDCGMMMRFIAHKDFDGLMQEFDEMERLQDAAGVMEAMGIKQHLWSLSMGKHVFRARMKKPLSGLQKMDREPGSCPSYIIRRSIHQACVEIEAQLVAVMHDFERSFANGNPHIVPSKDKLAEWLKQGMANVELNNTNNVVFSGAPAAALLKCIDKFIPDDQFEYFPKMNVEVGAEKLLKYMGKGGKMSDDVYQVWWAMWNKFGSIFLEIHKPFCTRYTMRKMLSVLYQLCTRDGNFDQFIKSVELTRKIAHFNLWDWISLLQDCVASDNRTGLFAKFPNKNKCIHNMAMEVFRGIGWNDSIQLKFMSNYIQWLYHAFGDKESMVVDHLLKIIDQMQIAHVESRMLTEILMYYLKYRKKPVPTRLQQLLQKGMLPVNSWTFQ